MEDTPHQAEKLANRYDVNYQIEAGDVNAETFDEARQFNEQVAGLVGAAVVNDTNELLFIHHEGYNGWVLPGGVAEIGENLQQAAIREVYEETGVRATIIQPLLVIKSVTRHEGRTTSGYFVLFEGSADDDQTADNPGLDDEPITEVKWVNSIPDTTSEDETVQKILAVLEERFSWLD